MFQDYVATSSAWPQHNRQFQPFQRFRADRLSANPIALPPLACATKFGMALASGTGAMLRINCEAAMWKITTRGFTLDEVLVLAAMNLLAIAVAKRERQASQKSKGDQA